MACVFLSISLLWTNIILIIVAEQHLSTENTQLDSPNENTENEAIVSEELFKSNVKDPAVSQKGKEYAKLISNEKMDENEDNNNDEDNNNAKKVVETVTIDKNDETSLKDFVLNNKDQILDILQEHIGKLNDVKDDANNGGSQENNASDKQQTDEDEGDDDDNSAAEQYRAEIKAGNKAEGFGTNPHYYQPHAYQNLGRRRSSRKHTKEVNTAPEETAVTHLEPKLASPEFVLEIAKKSALLEASKPKNPSNDIIQKKILRSGNYWNSVWKEEADPKQVLRSSPSKQSSSLGIVQTQINPGSKLYELIKKLSGISPRLIYVINKKSDF